MVWKAAKIPRFHAILNDWIPRCGNSLLEMRFLPLKIGFLPPKMDFLPLKIGFLPPMMDFLQLKIGFLQPKIGFLPSMIDFLPPMMDFLRSVDNNSQ